MTIGDKIKKIRTFRNMTQAELGAALGWGDKGANRLAQYETNYWVPRKDLVTEMAKILDVNPLTLHECKFCSNGTPILKSSVHSF